VEGAAAVDGRKPSIWDTYTHVDGNGAINPKGLEYYNNLINELVLHGIEPHVTLYHFDLPQSLEDAYGRWIHPQIIEDFRAFAEVCFREFGDRVKYWTTFNEPNAFPSLSYDRGWWPPQRCSYPFGLHNCSAGDSTVEPYIVAHHILLSHSETVKFYREKFQVFRSLFFGDYPSSMKKIAGSRLPTFTKQQSEMLKGSFDIIGVNHYSSNYIYDSSNDWVTAERDYLRDIGSKKTGT
ncbi:hypothetical protein KI387_026075, partial [Taxus chinensis]